MSSSSLPSSLPSPLPSSLPSPRPTPHASLDSPRDASDRFPFVYLASQSPRRRSLLEQIGATYRMLLPDPDEDAEALEAVLPGESPHAYVQRVCAAKATAARERLLRRALPAAPILCADTTVAAGDLILGKPDDAPHAASMLAQLAGTRHQVLTAVVVVDASGAETHAALSVSTVRFAALSSAQIDRYIATGEPFGKAGAYGIQGHAAAFIEAIEGSYSGIMGLPLYETATLLRGTGVAFAAA